MTVKLLIMGAAGRDFHVFNCCFRDDPESRVLAFTAAQIPHIQDRVYPAQLAGPLYPDGIPIRPEEDLDTLLQQLTRKAGLPEARGAVFSTFDVDATMLPSSRPVIAVTAVRTGCGKSQTSRRITHILKDLGRKTVVVRHPMPYGDLAKQAVQRFADYEDLDRHDCTIEEREEYEPHLRNGVIVYAGIDYAAILEQAEQEADVIVWDGGNNDTPFYRPDLWIAIADPHRPGHELEYFPGTENFRRADLIVINKVGSADLRDVETIEANARRVNPGARVIRRDSRLHVPDPEQIRGKRVLVIEDGPTTTHGGMAFGAGVLAARESGAAELVDPRAWAVGEIAETYRQYPDTGALLPAMGYGEAQIRDLEATVNAADCDLVLVATPIDLTRLMHIGKPHMRIAYYMPAGDGTITEAVKRTLDK